ncbi:MAG: sigma-54-dependent Fis family transcriptional regulator, partial [Treponema sp.]|nr:sigma-54-dependent Fis family transcriptional regulator [Treponema sp.]
ALELLLAYHWPGNVRELKNLAERIMVMWTGEIIKAETLRGLLDQRPGGQGSMQKKAPAPPENQGKNSLQNQLSLDIFNLNYIEAKELFEKYYLEFQLAQHGGVISHTAEAIGIYPSNLHAKIRKYKLRTER